MGTITIRATSESNEKETDDVFDIDLTTREIHVPFGRFAGVHSDTGVEQLKFCVARHYGESDLTDFRIDINIRNPDGEGQTYEPEELEVTETEITFKWTADSFAASKKGTMLMNVSFVLSEGSKITRKLNTKIIGLHVHDGLCFDEDIENADPDIIGMVLAIKNSRFYLENGDLMWERTL